MVGGQERGGVLGHMGGTGGRGQGQGESGGADAVGLVDVGQTLDLEALGHLEEGGEVLLVHGHLAAVHKLQQGLHLLVAHVLEEDDGMLVGCVVEHGLEVGRAGRQHHFVGLQIEAVAGQGDVHEGLVVEKVLEDGEQVVLVVVPAQAVLLGLGHRHAGGRGGVGAGWRYSGMEQGWREGGWYGGD